MKYKVNLVVSAIITGLALIMLSACSHTNGQTDPVIYAKDEQFGQYWYQGKAELNRYELKQVRYGEVRDGNAVLIFVTEDFFSDRQVKYEFGPKEENVQSVLKLNFMRRFYTGIYPYSVMTSVFYPVRDHQPYALKITFTAQEWCGHTFMQLNNRDRKFNMSLRSYFQKEGDQDYAIDRVMLEDEIWAKIRINPDLLPEGDIEMVPGMHELRFQHRPARAVRATAAKTDTTFDNQKIVRYQIRYRDIPRTITVFYDQEFPYQIQGWEEYGSSSVSDLSSEKTMVTRAHKTHSVLLDYWTKNSVADSTDRKLIGDL
jgi:hypothetical protein